MMILPVFDGESYLTKFVSVMYKDIKPITCGGSKDDIAKGKT